MRKRRNCTRSLFFAIIGIATISVILLISLYWLFVATAKPIEQNIPITHTAVTTETTVQTTTTTTAIIQTTTTTTVQTTIEEVTSTILVTTAEVTTTTTEDEIAFIEEPILTKELGLIEGPSGNETWYNLNMDGVLQIMYEGGYTEYEYWIREDGVKMFGQYIMCAADLELHPRGTIVETSLGMAMVCDTGTFVSEDPYRIDIAVTW